MLLKLGHLNENRLSYLSKKYEFFWNILYIVICKMNHRVETNSIVFHSVLHSNSLIES